jgi:hypothetical protein
MANLSLAVQAVLDEMSIIDPDYFRKHPQSEDEMNDEYSRFLNRVDENIKYNNFIDSLEKELELKSLHIKRKREEDKDEVVQKIRNNHYSRSIKPPKKATDLTFNDICSMEMDSFHYWLQEASIEELEAFGRFTPQSKKRKRNIIQLLLGFLNYGA